MPVQIGAIAHSFSDPTALLSDCHRRIKLFLGTSEKIAALEPRPRHVCVVESSGNDEGVGRGLTFSGGWDGPLCTLPKIGPVAVD